MIERNGRIIGTFREPKDFSGKRFVARYGLDPSKDYWTGKDEDGNHCVFLADGVPDLPDNPPIFEERLPDPKVVRKTELTEKLKAEDLTQAEVSELLRLERGL